MNDILKTLTDSLDVVQVKSMLTSTQKYQIKFMSDYGWEVHFYIFYFF